MVEAQQGNFADRNVPALSLANPASLADFQDKVGQPLSRERFRMNLWVDGLKPWEERDWVGKTLRLGKATLRVTEPIVRCRAINLQPGKASWDDDDLNLHLKRAYDHNDFGILCVVETPGSFKIGDEIEILG